MPKFYNGCYDIVFKTVICDETNPHMLIQFLEPILKEKIENIEYLQNELKMNDVNERRKIIDLLVKTENKYIHVELNQNYKDYLHIRNFCFFTNIYSKNTRKGNAYDLVSEYLHIDLSYGVHDEQEYREYCVMDQGNHLYIKNFKIIEYNMDRITQFWYTANKEKIQKYKYLIMLKIDRDSLNELSKGDKYMEEYKKKVEELNDSNAFTSWITPEEDAEMILNTEKHISFDQGKAEGKAEGIEIGIKQTEIETAKKMLMEGLSIDLIMRVTNLTEKQIEQMKA